jgi:hypothetical protein
MRSNPDYVQSRCTRDSFALSMAIARRRSRSLRIVLDPRLRVVDNLLDKFLHGARATFRVIAPRVVSTTFPFKPGFQFS